MNTKLIVIAALGALVLGTGCHRNTYVKHEPAPGVEGPKERHPDAPPEEEPAQGQPSNPRPTR